MRDSQWIAFIWLAYCCGVATVLFIGLFLQTRDRIRTRRAHARQVLDEDAL